MKKTTQTENTESNELQLRTGPYRTTFVGTEIVRQSTPDEWKNYGEILKRVDEAKQWAIGDWLVDGKRHYGDGLYREAEQIIGLKQSYLRQLKQVANLFELYVRTYNLSFSHYLQVASIETLEYNEKGKLGYSGKPDLKKMQELLSRADKGDE